MLSYEAIELLKKFSPESELFTLVLTTIKDIFLSELSKVVKQDADKFPDMALSIDQKWKRIAKEFPGNVNPNHIADDLLDTAIDTKADSYASWIRNNLNCT